MVYVSGMTYFSQFVHMCNIFILNGLMVFVGLCVGMFKWCASWIASCNIDSRVWSVGGVFEIHMRIIVVGEDFDWLQFVGIRAMQWATAVAHTVP